MRREPDFEVVSLPKDAQVDLMHVQSEQFRPIKLYVLPNGTADERRSFAFEFLDRSGKHWVAQISERMLKDACLDAGYDFQFNQRWDDGYDPKHDGPLRGAGEIARIDRKVGEVTVAERAQLGDGLAIEKVGLNPAAEGSEEAGVDGVGLESRGVCHHLDPLIRGVSGGRRPPRAPRRGSTRG